MNRRLSDRALRMLARFEACPFAMHSVQTSPTSSEMRWIDEPRPHDFLHWGATEWFQKDLPALRELEAAGLLTIDEDREWAELTEAGAKQWAELAS